MTLTVLTACNNNAENNATDLKTKGSKSSTIDRDKLDYYFHQYEIKPSVSVNNTDGNQTEIQLSNHMIKWLNTDEETKINIDNDLFTLKDKATLNIVWDNKDSVNFANNWDEIKLFRINDRELIGIRMSFQPCTGLGCSVSYFLIYDLQTKSKNFFGTFRADDKLAIYNFNNDGKLDYVSKTFSGDGHGSTPMEFIYELYSMEDNGHFIQHKNKSGQIYQIKQTTFPNDSTKSEIYEQIWLEEIN